MRFNYEMSGLTAGVAKPEMYHGNVHATSIKEAFLKVFVVEFGEPDIEDPFEALEDWGDVDGLRRCLKDVQEGDRSFVYDTGEFLFTISLK